MTGRNIVRKSIAQLKSRAFRRRVVRRFLGGVFHSADAALVEAGELHVENIHRILVLRPNHRLGNLLLLTPLIAELERAFPGAEIDVLAAGDAVHEVLSNFPSVRHIFTLPHYIVRHVIDVLKTIVSLRRSRYDLVIDPSTDSNSNRLLLSWIKPRNSIGIPSPVSTTGASWARIMFLAPRHFATLPIFFLRHALSSSREVNETDYPTLDIRLTPVELRAGQQVLNALRSRLSAGRSPITIGIFANASGAKRFDEAWWLRFLRPLINGYPGCAMIEFVPADGHSRLGDQFPTYYSSSPRKFAAVTSNLTCFISGDCGVMHLASASRTPTIGLFSVTDASMYEPYGNHSQSLTTTGKTPEQVAQGALRLIETIVADRIFELKNDKRFAPGSMANSL